MDMDYKKCVCGNVVPAGYKFCSKCGANMVSSPPNHGSQEKSKVNSWWLLLGAMSLIMVGLIFFIIDHAGEQDYEAMLPETDPTIGAVDPGMSLDTEEENHTNSDVIYISGSEMAAITYAQRIVSERDVESYYVHDMDRDGTSELILKTGSGSANAFYEFYAYGDGELYYLGQVSAGHSELYIEGKGVILQFTHLGYEEIYRLSIEENEILKESVISRTIPENDVPTQYNQVVHSSDPMTFTLLSEVYTKEASIRRNVSEFYFEKEDQIFSNGRYTFAQLTDGTVLCVDSLSGKVSKLHKTDADTLIVAITDDRVYLSTLTDHGTDIYACDHDFTNYILYAEGVSAYFQDGLLLLESQASDGAPHSAIMINHNNVILATEAHVLDACFYNGRIYYLNLGGDWQNINENETVKVNIKSVDKNKVTEIADIVTPGSGQAEIEGNIIRYYVYSTGQTFKYNLLDGEMIP